MLLLYRWLRKVRVDGPLALWRHFRILSLSAMSYPTQKCDFSNLVLDFLKISNFLRYLKQVTSCPILCPSMLSKIWKIKIWKIFILNFFFCKQAQQIGLCAISAGTNGKRPVTTSVSLFEFSILTSTCPLSSPRD